MNVPDRADTTSRIAVLPREGQTRTLIPARHSLDDPLGGDEEVEVVFTDMTDEFTFRVNLETLPGGTIVRGAAFDEASWSLVPEGKAALRRLGCRVDRRDRSRWSHAFIGGVEAQVGAVPEWADVREPAAAVGDVSAVFRRIELVPTGAAAPPKPRAR